VKVSQVVELAREWVELEGYKTPGFQGAHLMGSTAAMPRGAPFATYRDVDMNIVVPDGSRRDHLNLPYKGLILEVNSYELKKYRSPEVVLANPNLAPHLAADSILSDPTGMLGELHEAVSGDYARRKWVLARCEREKALLLEDLEAISQPTPAGEASTCVRLLRGLSYLAGLIAVSSMRPPTARRCLLLMRELLEPQGRSDLCEEVLRLPGWAHMTQSQVESYLQEAVRAFDRAVEVHRTQSPYGFKLHPYVRPYFVQAAQEMMNEGHHREAMFWVCFFHYLSNTALQNDAPEEEKARSQAGFDRLLDGMGLSTPEDWTARAEQARAVAEEVFQVADEIVAQNPEIVD
jgi:hypothetical protein